MTEAAGSNRTWLLLPDSIPAARRCSFSSLACPSWSPAPRSSVLVEARADVELGRPILPP